MSLTPEAEQQYGSILTILGENSELNGKLQNKPIEFTHIAIGDANDTYVQPNRNQTALVNEIARIPVNSIDVVQPTPDAVPTLVVEAIVPDSLSDIVIREHAVVATFNGNSYYHAVGNCARVYVPSALNNGGSSNDITVQMVFAVTSVEPIVLIDPAIVIATRQYVGSENRKHVEEKHPHPQYMMVDNRQFNGQAGSWYRIAEGVDRCSAEFVINDSKSTRHGYTRFLAGISFGAQAYINVIASTGNGGGRGVLRYVRVVSLDDNFTFGKKAIEVFIDGDVTGAHVFMTYDLTSHDGWSLISPVASQPPHSEHVRVDLDLTTGCQSTDHMYSAGGVVFGAANKPKLGDVAGLLPALKELQSGQFLPYNPSKVYYPYDTCTILVDGKRLLMQAYHNQPFSGIDPLDMANRHEGWRDESAPFYWIPYTAESVGQPFYWLAEDAPEYSVMEIGIDLPAAVYWRLAARYPHLVKDGVINTGDIRSDFIRVFDGGRGVDPGREINTWSPSAIAQHSHSFGNRDVPGLADFGKYQHLSLGNPSQGDGSRSAIEQYSVAMTNPGDDTYPRHWSRAMAIHI